MSHEKKKREKKDGEGPMRHYAFPKKSPKSDPGTTRKRIQKGKIRGATRGASKVRKYTGG